MKYVGFPNLGLSFYLNRTAFSIMGVDIYWYAIIIALGIVVAYFCCAHMMKKQGIDTDILSDILIIGIPSGVIGGRLYYVLFSWDSYKNNLWEIFNIRGGGLAIYGGIIFSVIAAFIYLKIKKINVLKIFDIMVMGLLIGQGIGRWGNFVNVEAHGGITDSFFKMAIEDEITKKIITVHPTFLYESAWNLIGALIVFCMLNRKKFEGQTFLFYIFWYGLGRFFIEGLRTDSLMLFNIRISQLVAGLSAVVGLVMYFVLRNKCKGLSE